MNSKQFIHSLKRLARKRALAVTIDKKRGKGSHTWIVLDGRKSVLPYNKDKLGDGLLKSICTDLGITSEDLK